MNSRLHVIERNQEEIEADLQILQRLACLYDFQASNERLIRQQAAQIRQWNWLFGMSLRIIISTNTRGKGRNVYDWFMPSFSISSSTVERFYGNMVVLPGTAPRAGDVYHA
jgi:hypothetical protein